MILLFVFGIGIGTETAAKTRMQFKKLIGIGTNGHPTVGPPVSAVPIRKNWISIGIHFQNQNENWNQNLVFLKNWIWNWIPSPNPPNTGKDSNQMTKELYAGAHLGEEEWED